MTRSGLTAGALSELDAPRFGNISAALPRCVLGASPMLQWTCRALRGQIENDEDRARR
jgi:hypothetical protein